MRCLRAYLAVLVICSLTKGAWGADVPNAKPPNLAEMADTLADRVFKAADHNHNHVLNKNEFAAAREMLDSEIQKLGTQGLIGRPKRPAKNQQNTTADFKSTTDSDKLARSNKVSPAEFTFFVHQLLDQADQQWREARVVAENQRKLYNAQRRAVSQMRHRVLRPPYPVPVP
jgi:hypothetical protein